MTGFLIHVLISCAVGAGVAIAGLQVGLRESRRDHEPLLTAVEVFLINEHDRGDVAAPDPDIGEMKRCFERLTGRSVTKKAKRP